MLKILRKFVFIEHLLIFTLPSNSACTTWAIWRTHVPVELLSTVVIRAFGNFGSKIIIEKWHKSHKFKCNKPSEMTTIFPKDRSVSGKKNLTFLAWKRLILSVFFCVYRVGTPTNCSISTIFYDFIILSNNFIRYFPHRPHPTFPRAQDLWLQPICYYVSLLSGSNFKVAKKRIVLLLWFYYI